MRRGVGMESSKESGPCVGPEDPIAVNAAGGHPAIRSEIDSSSEEVTES